MDSIFAPEQVAEVLKKMPLNFTFGEYDGDNIIFQHQGERIAIDGIIQRWQGTEAHIEMVAEVKQSLLSNKRRNSLIGLVVGVAGILSYALINLFRNLTCQRVLFNKCVEYTGFSEWDITLMLFGLWIIVAMVIWLISKYDPKLKQRWQAQQELGTVTTMIIEHIRRYENEFPNAQ